MGKYLIIRTVILKSSKREGGPGESNDSLICPKGPGLIEVSTDVKLI
jgi:hypothetical protein